MPDEAANRGKERGVWGDEGEGRWVIRLNLSISVFAGLTLVLNACIVHEFYTWVSDNVRVSPPVPNMC